MKDQTERGANGRSLPKCGDGEFLSTGDMARESGSTLRTVRFYEEEGLLEPTARRDGGHRYFPRSELYKLQLVLDLREAGLSLQAIKELCRLKQEARDPTAASEAMQAILSEQIEEMQTKIGKLRRLRTELSSMINIIDECRSCEDAGFPKHCRDCELLQQPDMPRALKVLWGR